MDERSGCSLEGAGGDAHVPSKREIYLRISVSVLYIYLLAGSSVEEGLSVMRRMESSSRGAKRRGDPGILGRPTSPLDRFAFARNEDWGFDPTTLKSGQPNGLYTT
jgi:hypothetical protein